MRIFTGKAIIFMSPNPSSNCVRGFIGGAEYNWGSRTFAKFWIPDWSGFQAREYVGLLWGPGLIFCEFHGDLRVLVNNREWTAFPIIHPYTTKSTNTLVTSGVIHSKTSHLYPPLLPTPGWDSFSDILHRNETL